MVSNELDCAWMRSGEKEHHAESTGASNGRVTTKQLPAAVAL